MVVAKRLIAYLIDYLVMMCYGAALFGVAVGLGLDAKISSPWTAHATAFLTLTLPVVLYFSLSESSRWRATIGKRAMGLQVVSQNLQAISFFRALARNLLKFLPWEIAHFGVHWCFYYNRQGIELPGWVWVPIIFAQLLALAYLVSIVVNSGHRGLYELGSGTRVVEIEMTGND